MDPPELSRAKWLWKPNSLGWVGNLQVQASQACWEQSRVEGGWVWTGKLWARM